MKLILSITACFIIFSTLGQITITTTDSCTVYGELINYSPGGHAQVKTNCCGLINISDTYIASMVKGSPKLTSDQPKAKVNNLSQNSEKDNSKSGNGAKVLISLIENTADVLTSGSNETSEENNSEQESTGSSSGNVGGSNNTNNYSGSVGSVCLISENMHSRKVILVNSKTLKEHTLMIQSKSDGCLYELPTGVYTMKVYTTFTKKLISQSQIQIKTGQNTRIKLPTDHLN